ncbi:hypothetical protein [Dechloromonas hortensis]|uniref:hypothetical protein n=1 Tax=Dechloromonas hortensis TaxID=337779 RepID=UPI001290FBA4|nr:hypothetical protein [Dechloromonas hortensis]
MKFAVHDLVKIRLPLLAAVLLLAIAGLIAWWSMGEAQKAEQERNSAANRKGQVEQRLRQVRIEEQELKDRAQTFQQLQASGISGEEKRLEWIEMLRATQQALRLPGMNYEFGVQVPLENVDGAAYAWFASPMRLQLRLLHEEDLLNFLSQIEKNAKALVLVRNCKLGRIGNAGNPGSTRETLAQLTADCEMQWITVRRASGKK